MQFAVVAPILSESLSAAAVVAAAVVVALVLSEYLAAAAVAAVFVVVALVLLAEDASQAAVVLVYTSLADDFDDDVRAALAVALD